MHLHIVPTFKKGLANLKLRAHIIVRKVKRLVGKK